MKAQREIRVLPYSFFYLDPKWGWVVIAIPGRFIPSKEAHYPLYRGLGGQQRRQGRVGKNLASTGIRSAACPNRSKSLYRPRCPSPRVLDGCWFIYCNLFMSNYSLFSNVSASQTVCGRHFLQMRHVKELRWPLPLLMSVQVMVML